MTDAIFITGATGFLGQHLLKALCVANSRRIQVLVRSPGRVPEGVEEIVGDLRRPEDWIAEVDPRARVIHLAALTGKARRNEHLRVNAQGSMALIDAAVERGLSSFLFLSSIAVAFGDRPGYPYAEAKERAESHLRASGLDYLILRPTMIFGAGSPVEEGLRKLAQMPLVPLFGGGKNLVQTVDVDALAAFLLRAIGEPFGKRTISIAGPRTCTMAELLAELGRESLGQARPALKLPIEPFRGILRLMEPLFLPWMPLTAGQLASFANDVTVLPGRTNHLLCPEGPDEDGLLPRQPDRYETEAQSLASMLGYRGELGDIVSAYADFVDSEPLPASQQRDLALSWLRKGGWRARMASVFAARFDRAGPLRRREAFILAQLECLPRSMDSVDRCENRGPLSAWMRFFFWGFCELVLLLMALPGLGWAAMRGRRS